MYFDEPGCISASTNLGDYLSITFFANELFRDAYGNVVQSSVPITSFIGRQMTNEREKETVDSIGQSAVAVVATTALVSLSLGLLLQASLN